MRQLGNRVQFDSLVLTADIGGTNTSLALVARIGRRYDIVQRFRYATAELDSFGQALDAALSQIEDATPALRPETICISAAGPVNDNYGSLTNVPWDVDGNAIASHTAITTIVINDFTAISYGIPLLDLGDPTQITPVPRPDGTAADQPKGPQAVVGAGTGLGIGYLVEVAGEIAAFPSEGGHAAFAPYDAESEEYRAFLRDTFPGDAPVGSERFVSGQALSHMVDFYNATDRVPGDSVLATDAGGDRAARVSAAAADGDAAAIGIMRLFVRNYARVASDAALHFLPRGGLFLAGGIVTKNERWFLEDDLFARTFCMNYLDQMGTLLCSIPVYIVKDYAISLYGAAHAAARLTDRRTHRDE